MDYKKNYCIIVLTTLLLHLSVISYGATVEYKGLMFEINNDMASVNLIEGKEKYSGDLIIPNEILIKDRKFSVICIAQNAISNCVLSNLTIPASIKTIGINVNCRAERITIEDSDDILSFDQGRNVISYGWYRCLSANRYLYIGRNLKCHDPVWYQGHYYGAIFEGVDSLVLGDKVDSINDEMFNNTNIKYILFGKKITSIGSHCFVWSNFNQFIMPNNITTIGEECFIYSKAECIVLSDNIVSISSKTFWGIQVNEFVIGEKSERIEKSAFTGANIRTLKIKSNISEFGYKAFDNATINEIYLYKNTPNISTFESPVFSTDTYLNCKLYVPKGSKEKYMEHPIWGKFLEIEEQDGTTDIGSDVIFNNMNSKNKIIKNISNTTLYVYTFDGRKYKSFNIVKTGEIQEILNSLPKNLYIIKYDNISFKYSKQ